MPSLSVRNALFHAVARGEHLEPVTADSPRRFDAAGRPLPNGSLQVDFMFDRIHYNNKGQALVAGLIAAFLRSHLPSARGLGRGVARRSAARTAETWDGMGAAGDRSAPETESSATGLPRPLLFARGSSFELDADALVCVRGRDLLRHVLLPPGYQQPPTAAGSAAGSPALGQPLGDPAASGAVHGAAAALDVALDGWRYAIEGTALNPKPGLIAFGAHRRLPICWRPPHGAPTPPTPRRGRGRGPSAPTAAHYAFKLGFLKSYGPEYGAALLTCSGRCSCPPTWLDARAGPRDRHRVSLHVVENVVLTVQAPAHAAGGTAGGSAGGSADTAGAEGALEGSAKAITSHAECCVITVETRLLEDLPQRPGAAASKGRRGRASISTANTAVRNAAANASSMKFKVGCMWLCGLSRVHVGTHSRTQCGHQCLRTRELTVSSFAHSLFRSRGRAVRLRPRACSI